MCVYTTGGLRQKEAEHGGRFAKCDVTSRLYQCKKDVLSYVCSDQCGFRFSKRYSYFATHASGVNKIIIMKKQVIHM